MQHRQLRLRQIENRDIYEAADPEAFHHLVRFLRTKGSYIGHGGRGLALQMPSIFKALWRPDFLEVSNLTPKRSVRGCVVMHHAMHALIAHRYGPQLRGKCDLTMLAEGMAGALEIYFDLCFVREGGDLQRASELRHFYDSAHRLEKGIVRKLNLMLENPFEAFRENALSSFEISKDLLTLVRQSKEAGTVQSNRFAESLKKNKQYVFLYHKDFPNFVLYTSTYCGFKSSREDRRDTRDCLAALRQSRSMLELLDRLQNDT